LPTVAARNSAKVSASLSIMRSTKVDGCIITESEALARAEPDVVHINQYE
jgi:hypothetical protein